MVWNDGAEIGFSPERCWPAFARRRPVAALRLSRCSSSAQRRLIGTYLVENKLLHKLPIINACLRHSVLYNYYLLRYIMRRFFILVIKVAALATMLSAPVARAHDRVEWRVSVGSPGYYSPPPVYYRPPPTIYYPPPPIYYSPPQTSYWSPPGVYLQPVPIYPTGRPVLSPPLVVYDPPYFDYRERQWREYEWREHNWRGSQRVHGRGW